MSWHRRIINCARSASRLVSAIFIATFVANDFKCLRGEQGGRYLRIIARNELDSRPAFLALANDVAVRLDFDQIEILTQQT